MPRSLPLLALPLVSLLLIVDAQLGLYGLYIQWGIAPFRTLIIPAIELWAVVALLVAFGLRVRRSWSAFGNGLKLSVILPVLLLIAIPATLERVHAGFVADIDSQLVVAVQAGQSARIPVVRYKPPLSAQGLAAARCEVVATDATNFFHVREVEIACGANRLSMSVIYLWSVAQIKVRP